MMICVIDQQCLGWWSGVNDGPWLGFVSRNSGVLFVFISVCNPFCKGICTLVTVVTQEVAQLENDLFAYSVLLTITLLKLVFEAATVFERFWRVFALALNCFNSLVEVIRKVSLETAVNKETNANRLPSRHHARAFIYGADKTALLS